MVEIAKASSKLPADFLRALKPEHPYVKMGVHGPYASGKSWLVASVAAALARELARRQGGSPRPVAWLGSEFAAGDLAPIFAGHLEDGVLFEEVPVLHRDTRAVGDLEAVMGAARAGDFAIVCLDTETHFFEDWRAEMKAQIGLTRRSPNAGELGEMNSEWRRRIADPMRADPVHYLCALRQGQAYETTVDEETLRRESHASSSYARGEKDTGHEKNLMIRLDRLELEGKLVLRGFVEKDRTNKINGSTIEAPSWESLRPAILARLDYAPTVKQGASFAAPLVFHGPGASSKERDREARKAILLEEIEARLEEFFPGKSKDVVAERTKLVDAVFGTPSTTFVRGLQLEKLEAAHAHLHRLLAARAGGSAPASVALEAPARAPAPDPLASTRAELDAALSSSSSGVGGSVPDRSEVVAPAPVSEIKSSATPVKETGPQATPSPNKPAGIVPATPAQSPATTTGPGSSTSTSEGVVPRSREDGATPSGSLTGAGRENAPMNGAACSSDPFTAAQPVSAAPARPLEGQASRADWIRPPCVLCKGDLDYTHKLARWLLLTEAVTVPVALGTVEVTVAEGLYPLVAINVAGDRLIRWGHRDVALRVGGSVREVCGPCGERANSPSVGEGDDPWPEDPDDEGGEREDRGDNPDNPHALPSEIEEACERAEAAPMPSRPSPFPPAECRGCGATVALVLCGPVWTLPSGTEWFYDATASETENVAFCSGACHAKHTASGSSPETTAGSPALVVEVAGPAASLKTCGCCEAKLDGPLEEAWSDLSWSPTGQERQVWFCSAVCRKKWRERPSTAKCPRGECDGSGFHQEGRCLCKTGVQPPKPTEALSFDEARKRLWGSRQVDQAIRDLLSGEPKSVLPALAEKLLRAADSRHGRGLVDSCWLKAGARLGSPKKGGSEPARLAKTKTSRGLLRAFVALLPIVDDGKDRQSQEKDEPEVKVSNPLAPAASAETGVHPW